MISECLLQTDGYQILFELKSLKTTKTYFDMVVKFQLNPRLGKVSVKSTPTSIAINDLQRLVTYFEQHVVRLQQDPDSESDTFVPVELGFQVQALSGEIRSQNDGEFSIRFMVNVGKGDEGFRVYVGSESVIILDNLKNFMASLQVAIAELSHST